MNKIRTIGMAAMTILGIVAIASIGAMASGSAIISIVGTDANPGETVVAPIWATNIPGNAIAPLFYDIKLKYNSTIVTVSNVQQDNLKQPCTGIGLCYMIDNAHGVTEIKSEVTPEYFGPSLAEGALLGYVYLRAVGTVGQISPLDISVVIFEDNASPVGGSINSKPIPYVIENSTFNIVAPSRGGGGGGGVPPPHPHPAIALPFGFFIPPCKSCIEGIVQQRVGVSNSTVSLIGIIGTGKDTRVIREETTTDILGFYKFDNLTAGRYILTEKLQKGFVPTSPPVKDVHLAEGENATINFSNIPVEILVPPIPTPTPTPQLT